jgi:CRP-like cAMP-binding protein
MLRQKTRVDLLKRVPLFARCTRAQLSEIAKGVTEVHLAPGTEMIREGEPGRRLLVVVDGTVEVRRNGRKLPRIGGESFGEISLLLRCPTTATVVATSPVHALVMTPERFRSLLNESPGFQRRILLAVAERLAPEVV